MKLQVCIIIASFFYVASVEAKPCQIDRFTSNQLRLSSSYLSQAATSFTVSCDTRYAIQFNARNLTNTNGASYLVNQRNNKLRTQMNITGASSSRWNVPLVQPAGVNEKFVVLVQLLERPTAFTPAGTYQDHLYVSLEF